MNGKVWLAMIAAIAEMAQFAPQPGVTDQRIQSIPYVSDRVVTVQAAIGYAVVVELSEEEHVENIVVGNSGAWQVTANKRGDHLIIKPLGEAPSTDLVVTTDNRRYVFLLQTASATESAPFVMRFDYPQVVPSMLAVASTPTARYKLRGDKALFPTVISDDGHRTIVTWGHDTPLPAIFAADDKGNEAIVNGRMVGGDYVIERIAPRYVFRIGKAQAVAIRHPLEVAH